MVVYSKPVCIRVSGRSRHPLDHVSLPQSAIRPRPAGTFDFLELTVHPVSLVNGLGYRYQMSFAVCFHEKSIRSLTVQIFAINLEPTFVTVV